MMGYLAELGFCQVTVSEAFGPCKRAIVVTFGLVQFLLVFTSIPQGRELCTFPADLAGFFCSETEAL